MLRHVCFAMLPVAELVDKFCSLLLSREQTALQLEQTASNICVARDKPWRKLAKFCATHS
jgi:hypothetical protein